MISNIVDAVAVDKPGTTVSSLEKMAMTIVKAAVNLLNSILNGSPVSLNDPVYRCDDEVKVSISLRMALL